MRRGRAERSEQEEGWMLKERDRTPAADMKGEGERERESERRTGRVTEKEGGGWRETNQYEPQISLNARHSKLRPLLNRIVLVGMLLMLKWHFEQIPCPFTAVLNTTSLVYSVMGLGKLAFYLTS